MERNGESLGALRAYEAIRTAIVESRYRPGERLVEQRVADEFGLSRTPVREAIRRLEAEGLVETVPNRGAMVRSMTSQEIVDLYGLRCRLESYAAELAASRITAAQLMQLRAAVESFAEAAAHYDPDALESVRVLNAHNRDIHGTILEAAGHQRLAAMLSRTVDVPLVFQAFRSFGPHEIARSDQFHQLICEAITARRPDRAQRLMAEHIEQGLDVVMSYAATCDEGTRLDGTLD